MPAGVPTAFQADPYDYGDARRLAEVLDLAEPVAIALVRRGHRTVERAQAFLAAAATHDPSAFDGIDRAVELIGRTVAAGERITVHGDYDVDGICATAIVIAGLRRADADCDWLIPDRLSEGYGLTAATVETLSSRGTGLLITVDCGIGSVDEVAAAKDAGIEVIVTDHHQPGPELPDCPIVHPQVSNYPFPGLCGAAVAQKLVIALERERDEVADPAVDLDLVALATIADMVPLVDENRSLARRGLTELRRARRPGIRALLAAAKVEPERIDEGDIAFRVAPRINAAGRLYRADAAVELMLTTEADRAATIAAELDGANHDRRRTEREVSNAAEAALRELPGELREAGALVIAGEGWHPGVVGIVASRIVERHERPAVVLSIDGEGRARGSGRSIAGFDLLGALESCAAHLDRFGGHRAAAGVELAATEIDAFRLAMADYAAKASPGGPVAIPERIDAVVGAEGLDLRVAEQLEGLGPFGQGNPGVKLLVPSATIGDVRPMGEDGKHSRFNVVSGGLSARAVAFNANGRIAAAQRSPHDLTLKLELNHWNGSIEPRAVLDDAHEPVAAGAPGHDCATAAPVAWWWERFEAELGREPGAAEPPVTGGGERRTTVAGRRGSALARISELLSSGARVMVVGADAGRRDALAELADPARFGLPGGSTIVCARCAPGTLSAAAPGPALMLTDYATLAREPEAARDYGHLVLLDPPSSEPIDTCVATATGPGYLHEAWPAASELAESCWDTEWELRSPLAEIYRALAATELGGEELGRVLIGDGKYARSPESAARCVVILRELGIAAGRPQGDARSLRVVSSERTSLERSDAWSAYRRVHQEGRKYLETRRAAR